VKKPAQVKCPTCKKVGEWFEGPYGAFCSHRCKMVDLSKWFGEEHTISDPLSPEHLEHFADLPAGKELDDPEEN